MLYLVYIIYKLEFHKTLRRKGRKQELKSTSLLTHKKIE